MKTQILNLGKALSKVEQKEINGGFISRCSGAAMYYVSDCNLCVNTILSGAPTFCHRNCCVMAY